MRNHLVLLTLFLTQITFGQDSKNSFTEYPFQVVYAEKARLSNGYTIVGRYDYIKRDAKIQVDSGFLILMHHSEKLFEFSGDTVVSIDALVESMPEFVDSEVADRPDISYFNRYVPIQLNGMGVVCVLRLNDYDFLGDFTTINPKQLVTLTWKSESEKLEYKSFKILFRNILDEIVLQDTVLSNFYQAKLGTIGAGLTDLLIFEAIGIDDDNRTTGQVGIKFQDVSCYFPDFTKTNSSIQILQLWYHMVSRGNYNYSKRYLDQLNVPSNHPFYRNLAEIWSKQ